MGWEGGPEKESGVLSVGGGFGLVGASATAPHATANTSISDLIVAANLVHLNQHRNCTSVYFFKGESTDITSLLGRMDHSYQKEYGRNLQSLVAEAGGVFGRRPAFQLRRPGDYAIILENCT